MKIKRLEHVAITVKDMDRARETWVDVLGIAQEYEEEIQGTRLAMLPVGETYIELLQAVGPDSPVHAWMDEAGESLWHLCFEVEDIEGAVVELKSKGIQLLNEAPKPGHGGSRVVFLDPASTGNVLIELAELAEGH
ncbi:methylmalonyl-CoA epimerase [Billgrantia sulfidoxydans]|uniref:Methylmalonyl-CoA epimerase n=1 Tax=Billgrantia sulfidoxydans TaxID=2733484 RepID=A0ABX7WBT2_9GAMM|nr:methylmalonyl-CoA epimerase [Halomonas sulfidoxydans]QTP56548.1 methylmalonyl-CoA epimerase [Halomonas sulfidoxydans]